MECREDRKKNVKSPVTSRLKATHHGRRIMSQRRLPVVSSSTNLEEKSRWWGESVGVLASSFSPSQSGILGENYEVLDDVDSLSPIDIICSVLRWYGVSCWSSHSSKSASAIRPHDVAVWRSSFVYRLFDHCLTCFSCRDWLTHLIGSVKLVSVVLLNSHPAFLLTHSPSCQILTDKVNFLPFSWLNSCVIGNESRLTQISGLSERTLKAAWRATTETHLIFPALTDLESPSDSEAVHAKPLNWSSASSGLTGCHHRKVTEKLWRD